MIKRSILIIYIITTSICSFGQNCRLISESKDKKTGIRSVGGIVSSKDYYSLLIQKQLASTDSTNYILFLHASSRVMLSDSLLSSKGNFELYLKNGEKIIIENAECMNDPLGFGASIGFKVKIKESIIKILKENPIQKMILFNILETEFSEKAQNQQQQIFACIINKT